MSPSAAHQVVLGLGSNYQQEANIQRALDALSLAFGELQISSVYRSGAVSQSLSNKKNNDKENGSKNTSGNNNLSENAPQTTLCVENDYYNAVVVVVSKASTQAIKKITREIEQQCGRDRTNKSKVSIDIDFLLYGDAVMRESDILLPHPDIASCPYVLRPLADVLPDGICPETHHTWSEKWYEMIDVQSQRDNMIDLQPVDFVWRDRVISVSPPCLSL